MAAEAMLEDYHSDDKLDTYTSVISDRNIPAVAAKYFNLYACLPNLRDKTVLDLPCGLGIKARRFISEYGASKVVGVDIVQKQLDLSRQSDVEAGVQDGRIEHVCHDAKVPREIFQADVCVAAHLFCFAEHFDELLGIANCVYMNLKSGGEFCSISCSLGRESTHLIKEKLETFDQRVIRLDEWSGDVRVPRKMASTIKGFKFEVCVWDYEAVVMALKSAGFSRVELVPYKADPEYSGPYNLEKYMKMIDGQVVMAIK